MINNIELLINRYKKHMQVLNYSDRTVDEYIRLLGSFTEYMTERNIQSVQNVTKADILDYQKDVYYRKTNKGHVLRPRSQNSFLRAVRCFYKFLYQDGYVSQNPARDVRYAKVARRLPKNILTKKEIDKLFSVIDISTTLGYRDRTILEVLYSTGIRRDELGKLTLSDIDYDQGILRINSGKGDKDRIVPMGRFATRYLENYVKFVRPELLNDEKVPYVFISKRGRRIGFSTLKCMIYKYADLAGLKKRVYPHLFRHTCATHLIQNRANIRCVQELLGHKSLDTTQQYIQLTITDLKAIHRECHPREQKKTY